MKSYCAGHKAPRGEDAQAQFRSQRRERQLSRDDNAPDPGAFKDRLKRDVLFPDRLGRADEFASLALELLTNTYMNAEVVRLDAGARLQPK